MARVRQQWSRPTHAGNGSDRLIIDLEIELDAAWAPVAWGVTARLERTFGTPWSAASVYPRDAIAFDTQLAPLYALRGRLELIQTSTHLYVDANIEFGFTLETPQTFEGAMVELAARGPIIPIVPIVPVVPPDPDGPVQDDGPPARGEAPVEVRPARGEDGELLFPYVFMQRWPEPDPEEVAERFIAYPFPLDAAPSGAFLQALAALVQGGLPDARDQAVALAVAYIDGAFAADTSFIRERRALPEALSGYREARRRLAEAPDPADGVDAALQVLGTTREQLPDFIQARTAALVAVWQSDLALVVVLGYDAALRDLLVEVLRMAHVLEWLSAHGAEVPTAPRLAGLLEAVVILPGAIFPLPPAGAQASLPKPEAAVTPYALGVLQLTRHRRLGYAAGELAALECLQAGERRETVRRRRTADFTGSERAERDEDRAETHRRTRDGSLRSEAHRTLADTLYTTQYKDFGTTYGAPATTTVNGGWTVEAKPGGAPGAEDATRFAQEVLAQARQRLTHQVQDSRRHAHLAEDEESTHSVVDNPAGEGPRAAAYYWLDELFEAYVVRYGERLILELLLARPAGELLTALEDPNRPEALPVPAPAALGIETFLDVTPGSFPRLVAAYPGVPLALPPGGTPTVSAVLRPGQAATLALPEGAAATTARVVATSAAPGGQLRVVVGTATFDLPLGDSAPLAKPLGGELGAIQAAAELRVEGASIPPAPEDTVVGITVDTVPSMEAFRAWRLATFQAIQRAFQASRAAAASAAPAAAVGWPQRRSEARRLERQAILHASTRALFERAGQRLGSDAPSSTPSPALTVGRPRYLQFLDAAFEWGELSYAVLGRDEAPDVRVSALARQAMEPGFLAFLEAEYVRVLLPIALPHAPAVLFFLASGELWDGPPGQVQSLARDVPLRSALLRLGPGCPAPEPVGAPWTVRVPTAMKVLRPLALLPPVEDAVVVTVD
jgi:hypothetical protein